LRFKPIPLAEVDTVCGFVSVFVILQMGSYLTGAIFRSSVLLNMSSDDILRRFYNVELFLSHIWLWQDIESALAEASILRSTTTRPLKLRRI
jgi:hypothetical protein